MCNIHVARNVINPRGEIFWVIIFDALQIEAGAERFLQSMHMLRQGIVSDF